MSLKEQNTPGPTLEGQERFRSVETFKLSVSIFLNYSIVSLNLVLYIQSMANFAYQQRSMLRSPHWDSDLTSIDNCHAVLNNTETPNGGLVRLRLQDLERNPYLLDTESLTIAMLGTLGVSTYKHVSDCGTMMPRGPKQCLSISVCSSCASKMGKKYAYKYRELYETTKYTDVHEFWTLSPTNNYKLNPNNKHTADYIQQQFDRYLDFLNHARDSKLIHSFILVREISIDSLSDSTVRPHVHAIVSINKIKDYNRSTRSKRSNIELAIDSYTDIETNPDYNKRLLFKTDSFKIDGQASLTNCLKYMFKPTPYIQHYRREIQALQDPKPEDYQRINIGLYLAAECITQLSQFGPRITSKGLYHGRSKSFAGHCKTEAKVKSQILYYRREASHIVDSKIRNPLHLDPDYVRDITISDTTAEERYVNYVRHVIQVRGPELLLRPEELPDHCRIKVICDPKYQHIYKNLKPTQVVVAMQAPIQYPGTNSMPMGAPLTTDFRAIKVNRLS